MPTPRPRQIATAKELPFFLLDPREFERLCLWLVVLENYEDAQHLGAAGSEQGRDILAYRKGKRVAIQCKRVRSFSGKDAEREIDKLLALPAGERPEEIEFIVSADISADARARAKTRADRVPCSFRALTELDLTVKKYPEVVQEFFEGGEIVALTPGDRPPPAACRRSSASSRARARARGSLAPGPQAHRRSSQARGVVRDGSDAARRPTRH